MGETSEALKDQVDLVENIVNSIIGFVNKSGLQNNTEKMDLLEEIMSNIICNLVYLSTDHLLKEAFPVKMLMTINSLSKCAVIVCQNRFLENKQEKH